MQHLWLDQRVQLRGRVMAKKLVDVFDRSGARLFTYTIALEHEDCVEAEFEEVALIFAERSGLVAAEEVVRLRARCDTGAEVEAVEVVTAGARSKRQKTTVVSLIKHRMKRAGMTAASHRARTAS
jgi:hypothetical protein